MAGRPPKRPDLSQAGGRLAWCRLQAKPPISQDELADVLGFKTQSGVGNLEGRPTISVNRATKAAAFFRERLQRDVTPEWLHHGGPEPRPLVSNLGRVHEVRERTPPRGLDARVAALPEALQEYVLLSIQLAEATRPLIPAKFLTPPTSQSYHDFHEYLTSLGAVLNDNGEQR